MEGPLDAERCLERLASRLRRWRSEAGLTLQQLAERSGVAASTIHKIEVRKTIPTVSVLFKISQGLDRPVTDFLDEDPEPTARLHRRHDAASEIDRGVLAAPIGDPEREARGWRIQLAPERGALTLRAEGDVLVVCQEGSLDLVRQAARWRIEPGDVLSLRAPAPFRIEASCAATCRFLLVGRVPATARGLLDREAARARPSHEGPLAHAS
jgi:transcriptional regulator with XRE-family HTH domain